MKTPDSKNLKRLVAIALPSLFAIACSKVSFAPSADSNSLLSDPDVPAPPPILRFPKISDLAAVAFEDNFPKTGDADYNDFLTNFKVVEKINSDNQVTDIIVDFYPRAVGGSYDHSLLLVLSGIKEQPSNIVYKSQPLFNGDAEIKLTHFDASGRVMDSQDHLSPSKDVVIFASTHALFNAAKPTQTINTKVNQAYLAPQQSARLSIQLKNPDLNPVGGRSSVDISKLRMILHVKNTGKDIDLIDVDPLSFDAKGYPFGFIIPANWQWSQEGVSIVSQYPFFPQYQMYLLQKSVDHNATAPDNVLNWFMHTSNPVGLYPAVEMPALLPEP